MVPKRQVVFACWEVTGRTGIEGLLASARSDGSSLVVQAFASPVEPNPTALEMVAAQTLAARDEGTTLAERPELDLLLRIAGTRQIGKAFERSGYKSRGKRLFLVAAGRTKAELRRVTRLAKLEGLRDVPRRSLTKEDLDSVERAALLAART